MYLPVDQHILLDMNSVDTDVIHDFCARIPRQAGPVPGVPTKLRITPNKIGKYTVLCDELCGTGHYQHAGAHRGCLGQRFRRLGCPTASTDPAEMASLGAELAASQGCAACHNITGDPRVALDQRGRAVRSRSELSDGSTVTATMPTSQSPSLTRQQRSLQAISRSCRPATARVLTEQQISYLVAYIKSLQ